MLARQVQGPHDGVALLGPLQQALSGAGPVLAPQHQAATAPAGLEPRADPDEDPTAVVLATSGSTGRPRWVALTASALLASAAATHDRLGGSGRWLLALPVHHIAGLQVLTRAIVARAPVRAVDSSNGFSAKVFAEAAADLHDFGPGRRYTALVPTQLTRLLDAGAETRSLLAGFDAVLIGGAALPDAVRRRARQAGVTVVESYGSTETSGGVVYDGRPLGGVRIDLDVAPGSSPSGSPAAGRITVAGPSLALGYLHADGRLDEAATAECFVTGEAGRGFRTSDLGAWTVSAGDLADGDLPDGELVDGAGPRLQVLGRIDDAITSGGLTVAPVVVENALAALPGIETAAVTGVPDPQWGQRVVAAVVLRPGAEPPTLQSVRAALAGTLETAALPAALVVAGELPLLGPGKLDRAGVRRLIERSLGGGS